MITFNKHSGLRVFLRLTRLRAPESTRRLATSRGSLRCLSTGPAGFDAMFSGKPSIPPPKTGEQRDPLQGLSSSQDRRTA
eukprot:CAMPEP_0182460658 /NCGR_PEP_ID=MMETSP1319-20130603/5466_1 /TAXON_ID=172717 /ORGANISM="Bolidomonas pacifica, Strain RCC208" /LENGTH=79 /DNA_ID=CAMNT_0024659795 /DNA_START=32 /DNA_END=268 /DNA_ORIENTATION=-